MSDEDPNKQVFACKDIENLFKSDAGQKRSVRETFRMIKWFEAHILECKSCSEQYETLGTSLRDWAQQKKV